MTPSERNALIDFCQSRGIRRLKNGTFEVEFFPKTPEPMNLDPAAIAKVLADSMPPDSTMLFASTEDPAPPKDDKVGVSE